MIAGNSLNFHALSGAITFIKAITISSRRFTKAKYQEPESKMQEQKILNKKEINEILELIELQWGAKLDMDYGFLMNNKKKVFIVNREISKINFSKLRLNSIGLYFCELDKKGIRLSIEGSQLIGTNACKNIAELDYEDTKKWFMGGDLEKECKDCSGFVLLRYKNDFLGSGKYVNGKILNYLGKPRRANLI